MDPKKIASDAAGAAVKSAAAAAGAAAMAAVSHVNTGLSAAKSLESKISDRAKKLAGTIKISDIENFFVGYQDFGSVKHDSAAQMVVACLTHEMRGADLGHSLWRDTVQFTLTSLGSMTLFASSMERLYLLSVLLKFEESFSRETLAERIGVLKLLQEELRESVNHVDADHSLIKETKVTFVRSIIKVADELSTYIKKLELDVLEESIHDALVNVDKYLTQVNASLVRTIQNLHAPSADFSPLDLLLPGIKYPQGLTNNTRETLASMMDIPSAFSLFEVDESNLVNKLYAHKLTEEASRSSLARIYGEKADDFFKLISDTYILQKEIKELIDIHKEMKGGVRLFGEIMLGGSPKLKGVIKRHVDLIRLMFAEIENLYVKIDKAIASTVAHSATTRFILEHRRFEEFSRLAEVELRKISISLGSMDHEYLRTSLRRFIDAAVHGAMLFRKYGGECSDEEVEWLRGLERVLVEHSCEYLGISAENKAYIEEVGIPDSVSPEALKAEFKAFKAEGATTLIAAARKRIPVPVLARKSEEATIAALMGIRMSGADPSKLERLRTELCLVLFTGAPLVVMNKAYSMVSVGWRKSKESAAAKEALKAAIIEAIGKGKAPLILKNFSGCNLVQLRAIDEAFDRVCLVSSKREKRDLFGASSRIWRDFFAPSSASSTGGVDSEVKVEVLPMKAFLGSSDADAGAGVGLAGRSNTVSSTPLSATTPAAGGAGAPAAENGAGFFGPGVTHVPGSTALRMKVSTGTGTGLSPVSGFMQRR